MSDTTAAKLKEEGNYAYRCGKYQEALDIFSNAIQLDPENENLFCNRSMCFAALHDWISSATDAKKSVSLSQKYVKAHFRLVKAQLELQLFRDARQNLLNALYLCGECKELKILETEILLKTKIPLRPKSTDFEVIDELGEGNFSKIFKVSLKSIGDIYAMKVIDKANAKKMERRHKNINNEILMEKRVLNKLSHPNIVTMYGTFQDEGSLYYQMEFLEGGELWGYTREKEEKSGLFSMVGVHWSLMKFYIAEIINALEYMHKKGIAHRDIKPENILLTGGGHIKLIDFGTAKDLIDTDLNGPNFVGTSEYMSPDTVNSKPTGIEGDLWALGIVLFQCLTGCTAFYAASPYLVFLLIKRALVRYPTYAPPEINSFLKLLLEKDGDKRLMNALGGGEEEMGMETGSKIKSKGICYDFLRGHDFFALGNSKGEGGDTLNTVEGVRMAHTRTPVKVPLLSEISLRALGSACVHLSEQVALNGGVRPDVPWMQAFDLKRLSATDRGRVAHYLNRRHRLHIPGTHRLFFPSAVAARCNRVDASSLEYIGYGREAQGLWDKSFFFAYICDPLFGLAASQKRESKSSRDADHSDFPSAGSKMEITEQSSQPASSSSSSSSSVLADVSSTTRVAVSSQHLTESTAPIVTPIPSTSTSSHTSSLPPTPVPIPISVTAPTAPSSSSSSSSSSSATDVCDVEAEMDVLRKTVSAINRLRPRFVVVSGSFTHAYPSPSPEHTSHPSLSSSSSLLHSNDDSNTPSVCAREEQLTQFMRTMARVSETIPLLFVPGDREVGECPTPDTLSAYCKLFGRDFYGFWYGGLRCLVVNSPLLRKPEGAPKEASFQRDWLEEEIEQAKLCSTHIMVFSAHPWFLKQILQDEDEEGDCVASASQSHVRTIPMPQRMHWLKRLRHSKVRFLFSGGGYSEEPNIPHTTNAADDVRDGDVREGAERALDVRGATLSGGTNSMACHTTAAAAVSISAPLSFSVSLSSVRQLSVRHDICGGAKSQESKRKPFPKALFPPPPEMTDEMEGESEETRTKRIKEMKKSLKKEAKAAKMGETKDEGEWGTYDDPDSEDEEDEGKEEEEEEWTNQDENCEGPFMVITSPLGAALDSACAVPKDRGPGIRLVRVSEHDVIQEFFPVEDIPKTAA